MNETYLEINLDNISNNIKEIKKKYDYKYYIGVVKSDAYGHGNYIVDELYKNGINYVAVSYLEEALNIRKLNKDINILCLQPISISEINTAIKNDITITIHDKDYFDQIYNKINDKIKVHLKIDSGMNRLGFKNKDDIKYTVDKIKTNKNIILEGIYTHFATIGLYDYHYDNQVEKFLELTSLINLKEIPIVHLGSSVILLTHKKLDFVNGIRTGIIMYGYNVSPIISKKGIKNKLRNIRNFIYKKRYNISETYTNVNLNLKPAMKLYTSIIQIKKVKKGEFIGYGAHYKAKENMTIGILPIGYNNGIGINKRYVIINNVKYYSIGDIGMNMMSIKIDNNVNINDKVTILGDDISLGIFSRFNNDSLAVSLLNVGKGNKKSYIKNNKIVFESR